jgi:hypothetical protein
MIFSIKFAKIAMVIDKGWDTKNLVINEKVFCKILSILFE